MRRALRVLFVQSIADRVLTHYLCKRARVCVTWTTLALAPPDDWREVLEIIKEMRRAGGAPVDSMGCEKISDDAAPDDKGRRAGPALALPARAGGRAEPEEHVRAARVRLGVLRSALPGELSSTYSIRGLRGGHLNRVPAGR